MEDRSTPEKWGGTDGSHVHPSRDAQVTFRSFRSNLNNKYKYHNICRHKIEPHELVMILGMDWRQC
jgi:hypothetical protein